MIVKWDEDSGARSPPVTGAVEAIGAEQTDSVCQQDLLWADVDALLVEKSVPTDDQLAQILSSETAQIPNSFLTSFRNRQSVPVAMILSGDDLIMPSSR